MVNLLNFWLVIGYMFLPALIKACVLGSAFVAYLGINKLTKLISGVK